MADLAPVLTALAATLGGAAALVRTLPHLRRLGFGDSQRCIREKAELKAEADVWHEKCDLALAERNAIAAERDVMKTQLSECVLARDFAQRSGDEARRELDDLRSAIRARSRGPRRSGS